MTHLHWGTITIMGAFFVGVIALGIDVTGAAVVNNPVGSFSWNIFIASVVMATATFCSIWYAGLRK